MIVESVDMAVAVAVQNMTRTLQWDVLLKDDEEGPLPRRSVPPCCRLT